MRTHEVVYGESEPSTWGEIWGHILTLTLHHTKKKNHTGNFHRKEYFSGYMISVFLLFVFYKINCYMISVSYYIYQFINVIEKGNK